MIDHAIGEREESAGRYVEQLRAFYVHAAVFAAGMTALVRLNRPSPSSSTWEQRQIDKMLRR